MSECFIKFKSPVSKEIYNYLVVEYLKYTLYCRGQFPLPLDQLKRTIQISDKFEAVKIDDHTVYYDENNQPRNGVSKSKINERTKQNFVDSVNKFDEFFTQLQIILQNEDVLEVVLSLGANMMSPRELHRITLPPCWEESCNASDPSKYQRYRLEFFKALMKSSILQDVGGLDNPIPMSVLLKLKSGVRINEYMEQKRFYVPPKKCKQVTVRFDVCNETNTVIDSGSKCFPGESAGDDLTVNGESLDLWVRLKSELKGFKIFKESVSTDLNVSVF